MITDYVLVVSLDRHGNVFSAAGKSIEPDAHEIFIGGCLPLGIPFDLSRFRRWWMRFVGVSETAPGSPKSSARSLLGVRRTMSFTSFATATCL